MTSSAGTSGLIFAASPPSALHRLAHGGEVDDGGHAGQVLQDDPAGRELDLGVRLGGRIPLRQRGHVVAR